LNGIQHIHELIDYLCGIRAVARRDAALPVG